MRQELRTAGASPVIGRPLPWEARRGVPHQPPGVKSGLESGDSSTEDEGGALGIHMGGFMNQELQ